MAENRVPTAIAVVIGNEILSGRTRDTNLQYLGEKLGEIGIRLAEARVIPDVDEVIVGTINEVRRRFDYVFTTGGIGPTHDDITAAAIARAFGVELRRHPEAVERLRRHYEKPEDLTVARLKMAEIPEGASLIENPVSAAPGFRIGNVHVMAGVPKIMQAMFDGIRHTLRGGPAMVSRTVVAFLPEGLLAEPLAAVQHEHSTVEIGSYPFFRLGKGGASLVARGYDAAAVESAAEAIRAMIRSLGGIPE
jgi:molybdenum cofactor synthesis domain-containing protein